MSINEIIENENIRSDRYAMAAISFIFKAFGDSIRSKEYWPWGKDVQCEWTPSKGTSYDITQADLLLRRAKNKFYEENGEYRSISDKYVSMFKIENVEYIETIDLMPTYKVKINALHYYEKDNAAKIYQLKEGDYLWLTFDDLYTIFRINSIDINTKEIIIDKVFGEYNLNSNSLYRYNPTLKAEGKNPFTLDSKEPKGDFKEFLMGEVRYASLAKAFPEVADQLFEKTHADAIERLNNYKRLANQE